MTELDVLCDVVKRLNSIHVSYMLTGSFAMNCYAEPRMTRDIDIVIELRNDKKKEIFDVFSKDFYLSESALDEAIKLHRMFNVIHEESVLKIDFIIRKESYYRKEEFKRKQKFIIGDCQINIVSIEDLIISKLIWSKESKSDLQKKDILNLLNQKYDEIYLSTWLQNLELFDFYKEFVNE